MTKLDELEKRENFEFRYRHCDLTRADDGYVSEATEHLWCLWLDMSASNSAFKDELQTLHQRVAELEAEQEGLLNDTQSLANCLLSAENQILAQQDTINKMREALVYWRDECSGFEPSISVFALKVTEALALQPSTAELTVHDEQIRVDEREACVKLALNSANLSYAIFAIRQRKTNG